MRPKLLDPHERIFTLNDIGRLIARHRGKLFRAALIGALGAFLCVIVQPPVYKIEATFKGGGEETGVEFSMKDFLLSGLKASQDSQTLFLMQTRQVMKPVIEKQGLQATVLRSAVSTFFRHLRDHLRSQFALPIKETDWFAFERVFYEGEEPALFLLRFSDREKFQVFDEKGRKLAEAIVGEPVSVKNSRFTCSKTPSKLRLHRAYRLEIAPSLEIERLCRKKFVISAQKNCPSICDLVFYWPDRFVGAEVLNDLMGEYRAYLKRDRDEVAAEQVAYLEKKQAEICNRFETLFDDHAAYLTAAMKEKGMIGLEQQMHSYLDPHEEMRGRLLSIEIELERIEGGDSESKELSAVFEQIRSLEHERAVLLKSVPPADLLADKGSLPWQSPPISEPIDLESARTLYSEYASRLDAAQASKASLSHFREKIEETEFEIGSLCSVLKDPVSQTLIDRAAALSLQLKEIKYSSAKERERWQEEISLQKSALAGHLGQMEQVEALNAEMIRGKIGALQRILLDGIERQTASLEQQIQDAAFERTLHLQDEKKLLQKKMEQLRAYAADLPQRWKLETWLQVKTDMGKKIMTVMAELVESKTIGRHLLHIESKPLDLAQAPFIPHRSLLFSLVFLGAFGSAFALFWALFLKTLFHGFPLTGQKLKAIGYPFSGELTTWCDGQSSEPLRGPDLETIRQIGLFLEKSPHEKIVALIGAKGPNYSHSLAENLKRAGRRVCVIDCDFRKTSEPLGLLQWIRGEIPELPLASDRIGSGGFSPFGAEAIQSNRFEQALNGLKNSYDYVFLWQRAPLDSADTEILLTKSERAVVAIAGERTEELTPLLDWAYHEGNSRITFISSE